MCNHSVIFMRKATCCHPEPACRRQARNGGTCLRTSSTTKKALVKHSGPQKRLHNSITSNCHSASKNCHSDRGEPTHFLFSFAPAKESACKVEESLFDLSRSHRHPFYPLHDCSTKKTASITRPLPFPLNEAPYSAFTSAFLTASNIPFTKAPASSDENFFARSTASFKITLGGVSPARSS